MRQTENDITFMKEALKEAQLAADKGEVPIGAIIVFNNKVISRSHNQVELLQDPTAHAELLAITAATHYLSSKYLTECTLYVTIEPCSMCSGALFWSKIKRIVFGSSDPKQGYYAMGPFSLHPRTQVRKNLMAKESSELLIKFFKKKRKPYIIPK